MCVCIIILKSDIQFASKGQLEGKDIGEMWAAVIKTVNNLLQRSMVSSVGAPKWGQSRCQYTPRREPCRMCSRGASRRPNPKYVQLSIYVCFVKRYSTFFLQTMLIEKPAFKIYIVWYVHEIIANSSCPVSCTNCVHIITGVYFSQVKNKPWIPWVYTWSWHCREQLGSVIGIGLVLWCWALFIFFKGPPSWILPRPFCCMLFPKS